VSCSKDAYEEVLSYDKNSIKVVVLNSTAIKKEKPLFTKISKLNQNLSSLNSQEKNISSGVYNFSIDTEYCKMITLDSIRTYTFNVIREPSNDDFENLVIKKLPNGSLITKLYKYNVTPLEKHNILHGIDVDMTNKIEVSDINDTEFTGNIFGKVYYSGSLCYQAEMVMTSGTSCKGDDHHAYGDLSCPFINSPYMQAQAPTLSVVYVPIDCGGAGTGSGTTGTGNTGGVVSSGHGIVTSPIVPTISFEESMFKEFKKKSLTTAQNNWLTTQNAINENIVASIMNYLSLNDFDTNSTNNIVQLIDIAIANGGSFVINNSNALTNSLNFNTVSEFENYLNNSVANVENIGFEDLIQNQRLAKCDFSYGTFGISVRIKQKMLPLYEVLNVTSVKTGLSILLSWTQTDYIVDVVGSLVNIDVYGTAATGVNIGLGLNLTYEADVHYHIVIDKNTGQIITANEIND
jgi:hypothetical protein